MPSDMSKNSVYIMMEDGVVKAEQNEPWSENRYDIEANDRRRERRIMVRTDVGVV